MLSGICAHINGCCSWSGFRETWFRKTKISLGLLSKNHHGWATVEEKSIVSGRKTITSPVVCITKPFQVRQFWLCFPFHRVRFSVNRLYPIGTCRRRTMQSNVQNGVNLFAFKHRPNNKFFILKFFLTVGFTYILCHSVVTLSLPTTGVSDIQFTNLWWTWVLIK